MPTRLHKQVGKTKVAAMSQSDVSPENPAQLAEASVRRAVDALQQGAGQYDGSAVEAMKQARAFFNSQNLYAQAATCAMNLGDHFWKKKTSPEQMTTTRQLATSSLLLISTGKPRTPP